MPNYGLVINSTYDPMSFAEYAAPFEKYAEVYNKMADAYDALEAEASQWEKLAHSEKDKEAYAVYKSYADLLRIAANDLAENGLSTKTRGMVSLMRKDYFGKILPISDAWDMRQKEIEEQNKALLQNPTIMFDRIAADTGLSLYMTGLPEMKVYSGNLLSEYTRTAASQMAEVARQDLMENGINSEWYSILGGQYYEKNNYAGITPEVLIASLYDPVTGKVKEGANKYLAQLLESAINASGMKSWSNWDNLKDLAYEYAGMGLYGALGKTDWKNLTAHSNTGTTTPLVQYPALVPRYIYSKTERDLLNDYARMFVKQQDELGNVIVDTITDEGIEALLKTTNTIRGGVAASPSGTITVKNNPRFYDAMLEAAQREDSRMTELDFDKLVNRAAGREGTAEQQTDAKRMLTELYRSVENPNDVTRHRAFKYDYDSTSAQHLKDQINLEISKTGLTEVEYDTKENKYKDTKTKKGIIIKDTDKIQVEYSLAGTVIHVMDKDGKNHKTYRMPSINKTAESNRDASLLRAHAIALQLADTSQNLNNDEKARLQELYVRYIADAHMYLSLIGVVVNKTETLKHNTFAQ